MPERWLGFVGLSAFALAWIPQSLATIRAGRCPVRRGFLALAGVGSLSMGLYAVQRGDPVFSSLNAITTLGAVVNLYYNLFPR